MKELKVLAEYVVDFSNMSDFSKEITKDFIAEADDIQVMKLLTDGQMVLTVNKKEVPVIKEKFDKTFKPLIEGEVRQARKAAMSLWGSGAIDAGMLILRGKSPLPALATFGYWAVYRAIRAAVDDCSKKCGAFELNMPKRQACLQKCEYQKDQALEKIKQYKGKTVKKK